MNTYHSAKRLSPEKADKQSKPIQKGRAAKGGKTIKKAKLLPRVSRSKKYKPVVGKFSNGVGVGP